MDSVIVPILNEELTILSFVVPKDFANRIEMKAAKIIEGFENHPGGEMDPNNKMMQSMSFVIQTSFLFQTCLVLSNNLQNYLKYFYHNQKT